MHDIKNNFGLNKFALASLVPSAVARMTAEFAESFRDGIDINLGVGYVNEETMPYQHILEALSYVNAHPEEHRMPLNYGGPDGSANLVAAVKRFLHKNNDNLSAERLAELRLIVGANGATSILDSLGDLFEPGVVVTADPYYYIYCDILKRKGYSLRTVAESLSGLQPVDLDAFFTSLSVEDLQQLRFVYIVTVNNPSGIVISHQQRYELVAVVEELSKRLGRKVPLIFDCAYDSLNHGQNCPEIKSILDKDYTIPVYEISTFSKILAPALRIGYLMGKNSIIVDALVQKTSDIGFSNSLIMQEMTAWMLDNVITEQVRTVNANYRFKAELIKKAVEEELEIYLESVTGGECGFYYYFTFKEVETGVGSKFYSYLSRKTGIVEYDLDDMEGDLKPVVVYVPGEVCQNPAGESVSKGRRQLRISYGFEENSKLLAAIHYMREACEYALQG